MFLTVFFQIRRDSKTVSVKIDSAQQKESLSALQEDMKVMVNRQDGHDIEFIVGLDKVRDEGTP
mgnify:CR=1 FL=1|tara:strand:- start:9 stop:200 length:192 start_codon:yes stop_codon:yes gene_type:complete